MPDLGGLISGALGGARDAVERVLVQFEANTKDLEDGIARLDAATANSETQHVAALNRYRAQKAEVQVLLLKEEQAEKRLTDLKQIASAARTAAQQREIAALEAKIPIMQLNIVEAQREESVYLAASRALATHTRMLETDAAALKTRAAAASGGPTGISSAGAAVLGGVGAVASMLAITAVMGLGRAIEQTALAYVKWGHDVEHTSRLLGSSAEQASVLLYTFQRFNLDVAMTDRTILQLSRHVAENEEKFAALGVQTRDTNGHFRNAYEIFDQVRHVLSTTSDSIEKNVAMMELLARAGAGGGASFAELAAVLNLTDEQMVAVQAEASRLGFVLGDEAARKAFALQNQMVGNAQAMKGLQIAISQWAMPAIGNLIEGMTRTVAVVQYATKSWANFWDVITAFSGSAARARLDAFVDSAVADFKKIGEAVDAMGGPTPDVSNASMSAAKQAATDAIRDQIAAVQEVARAEEEALREELSNFEATKQREIDLIEEQQHDSQRAHEAEIAAIEDEQRAADEAFNTHQRQREDTLAGLREQLSVMEEQWREEDARASLADAEKQLTMDKGTEVFRTRGMTGEGYQQAVADQNRRILADEKRVADEKKKIARDETKFKTDEGIKAIEAIATTQRRQLDDFKKARDEEVRLIRAQMKVDSDASAAAVKGIQNEVKAEKDRVEDKIKGIQNETRLTIAALNDQIKAADRLGAALDNATRPRTVVVTVQYNDPGHNIGERNTNPAPADPFTIGERNTNPAPADVVPHHSRGILDPFFDLLNHDYPHSMLLAEPTALIGQSGRNYGVAAASGPEPVAFGGVGDSRGEDTMTVVIPLHMNGREIGRAVGEIKARRAGHGYGRRR